MMKIFYGMLLFVLAGFLTACRTEPPITPTNEIVLTNTDLVTPTTAATTKSTAVPTVTPVPAPIITNTPTVMVEATLDVRPTSTSQPTVDRTLPPLSPPSQVENSEAEENSLRNWLLEARTRNVDIYEVTEAMVESGWTSRGNLYEADFDQDGVDEWLVEFHRPQSECFLTGSEQPCGGDFWIVGNEGVEYEFKLPEKENIFHYGPIATIAHFTDEYPLIIVLQTGGCGAHTCWDDYTIIGGVNGEVKHLIEFPSSRHEWGKTILFWYSTENIYPPGSPPTINMTYGENAILDVNGDGYEELVLVGGHAGSAVQAFNGPGQRYGAGREQVSV